MILKKPYAYLIKYFKVIHLVIAVLLCLVLHEGYSIYEFFNTYVQNNYTTSVTMGLSAQYLPFTLYLKIFLILLLVITIIVLLVHKKKPNILYFGVAIYYVAYIIFLTYLSTVFKGFEYSLLESTAARTIRDISLMILLPQVIFIIFIILRTLGFNLKKFNFSQDIKELQLTEGDSEEVEVNINFDPYKAKRGIRRIARELLYYVKENKMMVTAIGVVVVGVGLYFLYSTSSTNYDNTYKVGKQFTYQNLQITIKDSIISNLNYQGSVINKGKYYLVLKMNVQNNFGNAVSLDYNSFKIITGGIGLVPSNALAKSFLDYNASSLPMMYTSKDNKDVILIYELSEKMINKSMKIQLYNGSTYENGKYYDRNIFIPIKPRIIDEVEMVGSYNIKDSIKLDNTFLGNSTVSFNSLSIAKNQIFTYQVCSSDNECKEYKDMITASMLNGRSNNYILLIDSELILDKNSAYAKTYESYSSFAENFISIQYKIGDKVVSDKAINVTPTTDGINFFAFEVPSEITEASIIQAIISIRNSRYIVNLKA